MRWTIAIGLYPNPVEETLYIKMPASVSTTSVEIFDINGKLILTQERVIESVDVSQLQQGLYFVNITADSNTVTKKIVKN